jgi:NHL repeat
MYSVKNVSAKVRRRIGGIGLTAAMLGALTFSGVGAAASGDVSTAAGNGTAASIDGGLAQASFLEPKDILSVGPGQYLITEKGGTLRFVTRAPGQEYAYSYPFASSVTCPCAFAGIAANSQGQVFISDQIGNRILRFDPSSNSTLAVVAGGQGGFQDGVGTQARFAQPDALAVDANGNLFVADAGNLALRKIAPDGTVSTVVAPTTANPEGIGTTTGLAIDGGGTIFAVDKNRHVVRKIVGNIVSILAGDFGAGGYQDGTGTGAKFNSPSDVALDPSANLLITDAGNHRIRKITPAGVVTTVTGTGVAGLVNGAANQARLNAPLGAVLSGGRLLVVDSGNSVIRDVDLGLPPETVISGSPQVGSLVRRAVFSFWAESSGNTFTCSLDGAPFTACSSPTIYDGLADGNHSFNVRATNGNGTDPTPATFNWSIASGDSFHPVTVTRIADTRNSTPLNAGEIRNFAVTNVAGVPANASAVAINIAVVAPVSTGHLRVFPAGSPLPNASVLNFARLKNTPNHVFAKVGLGGQISVYAGNKTDLIIDINGYFTHDSLGDHFQVINQRRIFDDQPPPNVSPFIPRVTAPISPQIPPQPKPPVDIGPSVAGAPGLSTITVPVQGVGGVPSSGVTTLMLNISALNPSATGHLRVYPTGAPVPNASTHNFVAGDSRTNLVLVKPGTNGSINIYNASAGAVSVTVEVVGWFGDPVTAEMASPLLFLPINPVRALDTRQPAGSLPLGAFDSRLVPILGVGEVPASGQVRAVAVNIAAVNPTQSGTVTATDGQAEVYGYPWLHHPANENVANLVVLPISQGSINLRNGSAGTSHFIIDVVGYFVGG